MNIEIFYEEILNTWIYGNESEDIINSKYEILNAFESVLYDFVLSYSNYMNIPKDYDVGKPFSMVEIHVLTDILDNPGITVTELAKKWKKTNSAISQTVKKLLNSEYIRRVNNKENRKYFFLYVTDLGYEIAMKHKKFDIVEIIKTNKSLAKKFSAEEIILFNEILKEYTSLLNKGFNKEHRKPL